MVSPHHTPKRTSTYSTDSRTDTRACLAGCERRKRDAHYETHRRPCVRARARSPCRSGSPPRLCALERRDRSICRGELHALGSAPRESLNRSSTVCFCLFPLFFCAVPSGFFCAAANMASMSSICSISALIPALLRSSLPICSQSSRSSACPLLTPFPALKMPAASVSPASTSSRTRTSSTAPPTSSISIPPPPPNNSPP